MSASQPPESPKPSDVEYRQPAWIEPPADVASRIMPIERRAMEQGGRWLHPRLHAGYFYDALRLLRHTLSAEGI